MVAALLPVPFLAMMIPVPESPTFLLAKNRFLSYCSSQPSMVHRLSSSIFPCSFVRLFVRPNQYRLLLTQYHHISYSNVRLSFVSLRWAQLYVSLVWTDMLGDDKSSRAGNQIYEDKSKITPTNSINRRDTDINVSYQTIGKMTWSKYFWWYSLSYLFHRIM